MKIGLITSSEIRHFYAARFLQQHFELSFVLCEEKALDKHFAGNKDEEVIVQHFFYLKQAEEKFFGKLTVNDILCGNIRCLERGALNTDEVSTWIKACLVDSIVVFGSGIIASPVLEVLPENRTFNLHQGISPYYKGSGTNFWAFVNEEFEYIGATIHFIDSGIDTGNIVAHCRPKIEPDDTLHSLGCKTIKESLKQVKAILKAIELGKNITHIPQSLFPLNSSSKVYKRAHLSADAIKQLWHLEKNNAISEYLERITKDSIQHLQLVQFPYAND